MEKRINKIRKKLSADNATKPVSRSGPMKTLLVRVMTDDLKKRLEKRRKKPEVMPQVISNNAANNLRMLLDDYTKMKEAILQVYWQEFKDDHVGLMWKIFPPASQKKYTNKTKQKKNKK